MQVKSKKVFLEKQSTGSYKKYIGLVNGGGKVAEIMTGWHGWNKNQVEFTKQGLHHCVVVFFWSSGIMECTCMLFTFDNGVPLMRLGGGQWCGIIHYYWWTASIKPRLLFSRAGYAFWGLSLSLVYKKEEIAMFFQWTMRE